MSDGSQPQSINENAAMPLEHDAPCRRCSYNLRGLGADGHCPECSTPVGLSLHGMLRYADPQWVEKVARGLKVVLWMIAAEVLLRLAQTFTGLFGGSADLLGLGLSLVSLYGVWGLTTPAPGGHDADPNRSARQLTRTCVGAAAGSGALRLLLERLVTREGLEIVVFGVEGAAILLLLAGEFMKLVYYQRLAERIPDAPLAKRANSLKWAFAIVFGTVVLGNALTVLATAYFGSAVASEPAMLAFYGFSLVSRIAFVVFGVLVLLLLTRLGRELAAQARLARETEYAQPARQAPISVS